MISRNFGLLSRDITLVSLRHRRIVNADGDSPVEQQTTRRLPQGDEGPCLDKEAGISSLSR